MGVTTTLSNIETIEENEGELNETNVLRKSHCIPLFIQNKLLLSSLNSLNSIFVL
jgi:hypothetical protein